MAKEGVGRLVVAALDEVAYLFNLRGSDVWRTPFVLAYAIVEPNRATLFIGEPGRLGEKIPAEVREALEEVGVELRPYRESLAAASAPSAEVADKDKKVWLDPQRTSYAFYKAVGESFSRHEAPSPLALMKARKNNAELAGMRAAHQRDAAALAIALAHLESCVQTGAAELTEMDVDRVVTRCRAEQWGYIDNSFDTIAGYGPNGAVIHYRAEAATASTIGTGAPLLLDSGAQYFDGTTDVTRTLHFGEPDALQRECFTRVLQGHIALASSVFPEGTPGFVLDVFARRSLWSVGLDYRHGTGHGVGAALAVHEGPQGIGQRYDNKIPLEDGMILSNEPGYYADGHFGIRIENLLVTVQRDTPYRFGDRKYFGFEPLTLVPIQRSLVDVALLSSDERAYLDAYHARVRKEVAPLLRDSVASGSEEGLAWLLRETEPLPEPAAAAAVGAAKDHVAAAAAVAVGGSAVATAVTVSP